MQKFLSGFQIDMEMVHPVMRPLLLTLGDHRHLSVNGAKRLSYLTQLFPSTFSEKLCEQLLQLLKKLLDYSIQTNRGRNFLCIFYFITTGFVPIPSDYRDLEQKGS